MICEICGEKFNKPIYSNEYEQVCSSECFKKKFWKLIIKEKDQHVISGHNCYLIEPEDSTNSFRGFGGSRFYIKYLNDNKVETSTNLWYQGKIPEEFWDDLPDNIKFITREEYEIGIHKN